MHGAEKVRRDPSVESTFAVCQNRPVRRPSILGVVAVGFAAISIALSVENPRAQSAAAAGNSAGRNNPVAASADSIAMGGKLYQKNCQFCHGPKGLGDGPMAPKNSHPSNLVDGKWDHGSSDGEIFAVIENGIGPAFLMTGVKGRMSETEIWHTINYLRSIGPKDVKTR
jgi:mono/diheme cytochrome c family protein